jgi:hypothetical protein
MQNALSALKKLPSDSLRKIEPLFQQEVTTLLKKEKELQCTLLVQSSGNKQTEVKLFLYKSI